ncbi:MAG: extracellular solute-binding protein [bacterium]
MTTLTMWIWGAGTGAKELVDQEFKSFKKNFPEFNLAVSVIPWQDAWDRIMEASVQGKGPDILQVGSTWNGMLGHLGMLRDLTDNFYDDGLSGDLFIPSAWDTCSFPGTESISSVPWFVDLRPMYYRRDLFNKAGLSANDLSTWESFEKGCEKLKGLEMQDEKIRVLGVSGQQETLLVHNIAPWIWSAGGDFLTPDGKKAAFNSQKALEGIEFYVGLVNKGYLTPDTLKLSTTEIGRQFFDDGIFAIAVPGPLGISTALDTTNPNYKPEIAGNCMPSLFPARDGARVVFAGGSNLGITMLAQHPIEAWEFVKYLISADSQTCYPLEINMMPALRESFGKVFREEGEEWGGLRDLLSYSRSFPNSKVWGAMEALLIQGFARIFERIEEEFVDMSIVKDTLDIIASDVDELLER